MATPVGIVGAIISSCTVKETLEQTIPSSRQTTRTIKQSAFDVKIPINSRTAKWSSFYVYQAGSTYDIDLTALPRTQPTDAGVTTFNGTGLRVLWWRIRNKHAANHVLVNVSATGAIGAFCSPVTNVYRLFGTQFANDLMVPIPPLGHVQQYCGDVTNYVPAISSTHKIIQLVAPEPLPSFIDAQVSILLGP